MEKERKEQIADLLRQSKQTEREDKERAERFSSLLKHPGFIDYIVLLNAKIEELGAALMMPSNGLDGMVTTEYQKGAMFGLILARDVVGVTVQIADEARKSATAEDIEDEDQ